MAKAASKATAKKPPVKRAPRKRAGSIPELDTVQDGEVIGPAPLPPYDTTHDVPAPVQKESGWRKVWGILKNLPAGVQIAGGVLLFLAVMGIVNTCNSSDRIKSKYEKETAPAFEDIKIRDKREDSLKGIAIGAIREAEHWKRQADIINAQLDVVMKDRNLSQTQQTQIRTAIKKQTDETTKSIYSSNSIADLDRKLDSLRRARKQDVIDD